MPSIPPVLGLGLSPPVILPASLRPARSPRARRTSSRASLFNILRRSSVVVPATPMGSATNQPPIAAKEATSPPTKADPIPTIGVSPPMEADPVPTIGVSPPTEADPLQTGDDLSQMMGAPPPTETDPMPTIGVSPPTEVDPLQTGDDLPQMMGALPPTEADPTPTMGVPQSMVGGLLQTVDDLQPTAGAVPGRHMRLQDLLALHHVSPTVRDLLETVDEVQPATQIRNAGAAAMAESGSLKSSSTSSSDSMPIPQRMRPRSESNAPFPYTNRRYAWMGIRGLTERAGQRFIGVFRRIPARVRRWRARLRANGRTRREMPTRRTQFQYQYNEHQGLYRNWVVLSGNQGIVLTPPTGAPVMVDGENEEDFLDFGILQEAWEDFFSNVTSAPADPNLGSDFDSDSDSDSDSDFSSDSDSDSDNLSLD